MYHRFAGLLTAFLLLSSMSAGQTQDVVYLKNGSMIKGTILEFVPDSTVKLQTADGSLFVFTIAEVEKFTREPISGAAIAPPASQALTEGESAPNETYTGSGVTVFGGISVPVGAFASTMESDGGAAKTGFAFGADGSIAFSPILAWITSVDFSSNSMDLSSSLGGTGLSAESGSWSSIWALTGLKAYDEVSPGIRVFGFAQGGLIFGTVPEITVRFGSVSATQSSASATSFGLGFGGGVTFSHVSIAFRYQTGKPEYEVTASGNGSTARGKFKQPTSCLMFTGGVEF